MISDAVAVALIVGVPATVASVTAAIVAIVGVIRTGRVESAVNGIKAEERLVSAMRAEIRATPMQRVERREAVPIPAAPAVAEAPAPDIQVPRS